MIVLSDILLLFTNAKVLPFCRYYVGQTQSKEMTIFFEILKKWSFYAWLLGVSKNLRSSMYQACVNKPIIVCPDQSKLKNLLFIFLYTAVILTIISMSGILWTEHGKQNQIHSNWISYWDLYVIITKEVIMDHLTNHADQLT